MAQIDIDEFVIALRRNFGEDKGVATRLDRCLFSLGLQYVDTPTGGRLERVDQPTMLEKIMWKSGEQKTVDKVEPKFKVGDWINGYYTNYKVISVNNKGYVVEDVDGDKINILFENEKFHRLWTIQDAKDGDVLSYREGQWCFIYKGIVTEDTFKYYALLSEKGITVNDAAFSLLLSCITPATKEQRDALMKAMADAGYTFDFEKKELKKIEPKPVDEIGNYDHEKVLQTIINEKKTTWSEEDEDKFNQICSCVEAAPSDVCYYSSETLEDWLKSLRPQNWTKEDKERYISCLQRLGTGNPEQPETINSKWFKEHVYPQEKWKPSDKQLEAVRIAAEIGTANDSWAMGILKGMYQDLKKLREG